MELNELPDELFHVLFGYLDVATLLIDCALVCKRWRELIHQMRFKELHFKYRSGYKDHSSIKTYFTNFWSHPPVPADPRHLVWRKSNDFFASTTFFDFPFIKMFERLKRLKLIWGLRAGDFSKLNQFTSLEELYGLIYFNKPTDNILKLPKLRVLDLRFESNFIHRSKLTVDCPVKVLFIQYYSNDLPHHASLDLVHPDLLEEIILSGETRILNFSACKNVRICRDYQYLSRYTPQDEMFPADHLGTFPSLEELHYQCKLSSLSDKTPFDYLMNAAKSRISAALQQKRRQNRSVKIYFQGIQLEGEQLFESFEPKKISDLPALQSEHYELLPSNLYYYDSIDYSSLEKHFDDSLPADLFSRFPIVNTVTAAGGVKHLDQFTTFLRQCKYLCELEVELDSLDQPFCDQLHVNCSFLKKLVFRDRKKNNAVGDNPADNPNQADDLANDVEKTLTITEDRAFKKFNFDFLAKQTNLLVFRVDEFDMATALKCLQIFPSNLFGFTFEYHTGNFSIIKSETNKPYSLEASFKSIQDGTELRTTSNKISIDDLAAELEFFKKKIDKLAL